MANRFPLIVNSATKRIEELGASDNLDLSNNGVIAGGSVGSNNQYLKSNGTTVVWDNPGDVYLSAVQTVSNKTFTGCIISGSANTFSNIANAALTNPFITVNGTAIQLGESVTTPDNNTTYSISAQDGGNAATKIIRLTSGGNFGGGVNDDVSLVAGSNVTLSRTNDAITINSGYVDTLYNISAIDGGDAATKVIRLTSSGAGATVLNDDVSLVAGTNMSLSRTGDAVTFNSTYVDTITRLRGTSSGTYNSGDITIAAGNSNVTVTQPSGGNTINISSVDTITRIKANTEADGNAVTGIVNFIQSGATTITRVGQNVTISSTDNNTVTSVKANAEADGNAVTGIVNITGSGFTTVSRSGNTFTINSTDANTTYSASSTGGLTETATVFGLKNVTNFTDNRLMKWDNTNKQFANSLISDNGSTVTVSGNLTVTGTTTTIDAVNLIVADSEVELRRGNSLVGTDAGIKVNRTTDAAGAVLTYNTLQWFESGGYWSSYDGGTRRRFVTETETQTLTNKTLTSPTLTTPTLGAATATSINGVAFTSVVGATLSITNGKTLSCLNSLTFSASDGGGAVTVGFGAGGTVRYSSNKLSDFSSTTSAELRGVISDEVGTGSLVFNASPSFGSSVLVTAGTTTFDVFNTIVTTINAFGAATTITLGATTGTTTVRNNLTVQGNTTIGNAATDTFTVLGPATFQLGNITIDSDSVAPIRVGRGNTDTILSNTAIGYSALNSTTTATGSEQNTAIGYEAGLTLNTGGYNTAVGYQALRSAGIAKNNVAFGKSALTALLSGERNVGVGSNTLATNSIGNDNVCIGHFAGAGATGSGNVLIGSAPNEDSTNPSHTPPSASGNNQLVISSGTNTWIRGDSNFDVTMPQNAAVGGNLSVSGNLIVNGSTTTINTNVLSVIDKEITLAEVSARTFLANITNGSPNITAVTPVTGLIPGMIVTISTGGLSVPANTTILSITNNTAVLSNPVTGSSGSATFNAQGATDTTANGGGIRIKGTTDKTLTYTNSTTSFTSSENFDLATGEQYRIGNVQIANGSTTTLGPTTGSWSIGAGVTASSLTSVGTLTTLTVSGLISSTFTTLGSPAITFQNDAASGLANNTFSIARTVKGAVHFSGSGAGTGGSAREHAITFRGNTADETQAGIYVIQNSTIGTAMTLATTDNYTTGPQQAITISPIGDVTVNRGNLVIGTAGKGIDFSATANSSGTMTSELLSDYEEGTWTPTVTTAGYTISASAARYTRIGNRVIINARIIFSAVSGTSNSNVAFSGLPFSSNSAFHGVGVAREVTNNGEIYVAQVTAATSNFSINSYNGVANGSAATIAINENYDVYINYMAA